MVLEGKPGFPILEISVSYTESQISSDEVEFRLENERDTTLENIISEMYDEGYNMEVFEE